MPWSSGTAQEPHGLSPEVVRAAARHVQSCADCGRKVAQYGRVVSRLSQVVVSTAAPPGADCPRDVDWHEVADGQWPELKAKQLIMHAALCNHCGPLLRAATVLEQEPTAQEEAFLSRLATPQRPEPMRRNLAPSLPRFAFLKWAVAAALVVMVAGFGTLTWRTSLKGTRFAEFAANIHKQQLQGDNALDFRSDSQQMLNAWLKAKLPFSMELPATVPGAGEDRPYRLEGARLVQVSGKPAVYISYRSKADPVSLVVTSDSVAVASGGVTVDYNKVSFHYRMVGDYKVVTWSLHGRTYALVSQEGNNTQRSCMVCHSAMRDRDLSRTPAPLGLAKRKAFQSILQ